MLLRSAISCILLLTLLTPVAAQQRVTTVGIQYKPIFPFAFLGTGKQTQAQNGVQCQLELVSGFCGGMVIRHGFSDLVSMEAGINYVKRKFRLSLTDGSFNGTSEFRIIGYEIPFVLMSYIQLGEHLYMNASMGPSFDFYASDVETYDDYFVQLSRRNKLFSPAILANLGWEWRTDHSGYFYIGASYHRPFSYTYLNVTKYSHNGKEEYFSNRILGNYLTLDFRYFFHENPQKKYIKR